MGMPMQNGMRRTVAAVLAAVSLGVLVFAALLILPGGRPIGPGQAFMLAVFLGLHTFALTRLFDRSPWADIEHLVSLMGRGAVRTPPTPPEEEPP